ncbi:hypothetical protein EDC01DRAFT_678347 [Geopyxis carbonaria]|nr:hypothetical protein EDC01DRAFT_678347 [Geopyxis carbonaria]
MSFSPRIAALTRTSVGPSSLLRCRGPATLTPLSVPRPSLRFQTRLLFHRGLATQNPASAKTLKKEESSQERELKAQAGAQKATQDLGIENLARAQSVSWHRGASDQPPPYQQRRLKSGGEAKLLSTPSRLLKLLLPLHPQTNGHDSKDSKEPSTLPAEEPLALLVHPHQPLSYLERLLQAELPPVTTSSGVTRPPDITFRARSVTDEAPHPASDSSAPSPESQTVRWSAATEVGDFLRDASKAESFTIVIENAPAIRVRVPSFEDRTHFLRQRLRVVSADVAAQSKLKEECDQLARRGAQRVAMGGFAGLITWWGAVAFATFKTNLGWDVMEPVTYLAGLSMVMLGYLWFLYHNREVSYRSVLHLTVSRRQLKFYQQRGFDMDAWEDVVEEARALRREIRAVAKEYDQQWDEKKDQVGGERVRRVLDGAKVKKHEAAGQPMIEEGEESEEEEEKDGVEGVRQEEARKA